MVTGVPWHLAVMSGLYLLAGVNHFRVPHLYLSIMPPYLPAPRLLNILAGLAEVGLSLLLLLPSSRSGAAWGIVFLLLALLPVHIHMLCRGGAAYHLPRWVLMIRLPLQVVLMAWAWIYSQT